MVAGALGVLMMVLSGPGTRWGWWDFRVGLLLFAGAGLMGLIAAGVGTAVWLRSRDQRGAALFAALGVALMAVLLWQFLAARKAPPIHDVTTDLADPPRFSAVVAARGSDPGGIDPGTAVIHRKGYADLAPVVLPMTAEQAFARAVAAAEEMQWQIVSRRPEEGMLEATATTGWFGFQDDIAVRIRPLPENRAQVDVRSTSRVGKSDVGANAKRIRAFLARLRS